jgi:hypothetical protein
LLPESPLPIFGANSLEFEEPRIYFKTERERDSLVEVAAPFQVEYFFSQVENFTFETNSNMGFKISSKASFSSIIFRGKFVVSPKKILFSS